MSIVHQVQRWGAQSGCVFGTFCSTRSWRRTSNNRLGLMYHPSPPITVSFLCLEEHESGHVNEAWYDGGGVRVLFDSSSCSTQTIQKCACIDPHTYPSRLVLCVFQTLMYMRCCATVASVDAYVCVACLSKCVYASGAASIMFFNEQRRTGASTPSLLFHCCFCRPRL